MGGAETVPASQFPQLQHPFLAWRITAHDAKSHARIPALHLPYAHSER